MKSITGNRQWAVSNGILLLLIAFCLLPFTSSAQDSLKWNFSTEKKENSYVLHITSAIPAGTIIYSTHNTDDVPSTTIEFDSSISNKITITGDEQFGALKKKDVQIDGSPEVNYFEKQFAADIKLSLSSALPYIKGKLMYMGFDGKEFIGPVDVEFYLTRQADGTYKGGKFELQQTANSLRIASLDLAHPLNDCGTETKKDSSLFNIFILGFLGGLIALLTPCVFPMIPLTVSFFTKKAGEASKGPGKAILYGFFIFLIYVSFSIPFHIIGNVSPTIYNDISTNIWLNLIFFIIFIVFAISFFGYFEISLPSGVANRAGAKRGTGLIGILFMALTLAIVSFSCTGPILGTLLVGTASGGAWPLTAGLAGFGLALGLPFALFAMFPQWLHSLPKSGGWLNTVKVVLGFIEIALAVKFLSNADLVIHWGLVKRELFFAIWILVGLGLFAYLMGWIRFPHDDRYAKIGTGRKMLGLIVLAFTLYLTPGVTNTKYANITLVSGFPPPLCYSLYSHPVNCEEPLKDYYEALKIAKAENKPIMIDFTGWACVNCRKMEENVWPDPKVKAVMEKFVLVSLYVDDKKQLPVTEQFLYKTKDSADVKIRTVGDKWATFQTENVNATSQPYYVLLSPDEKLLTSPKGYTPNAEEYRAWLQCAYDAFEKQKK